MQLFWKFYGCVVKNLPIHTTSPKTKSSHPISPLNVFWCHE